MQFPCHMSSLFTHASWFFVKQEKAKKGVLGNVHFENHCVYLESVDAASRLD